MGCYGEVFRGRLSDGRLVAVKLFQPIVPWHNVFNTELETHSKADHANVVTLIGYCIENHLQVLVFEYIAKKDLYAHLHPNLFQRSQLFNSWRLRVKVLLDVARGIQYLHQEANPRMIHRNIKSASILIDENWVAKISDFGFALFGPEEGESDVEVEFIQGTIGYRDPECTEDNLCVTQKSDVYSFGVVISEVITGRKAFDRRTNSLLAESRNFQYALNGRLRTEDVLDRRLALPVGIEIIAVRRVIRTAKDCVQRDSSIRPTINAVIGQLENALALFPVEANNN